MKTNTIDLWKLVCLNDDYKSFESLFRALNHPLIKFSKFYTKNNEAAEDIVSEVFVKCWQNRKKLTDVANPDTYLFVAVKNQSLNYIKKHSQVQMVELQPADENKFMNTFDPEKELEHKELFLLMEQAVSSLPPQACMVFRMIKENGLKYKEVAEIMNISPRTVQTHLFRSIKKLSELLSVYRYVKDPNIQDNYA